MATTQDYYQEYIKNIAGSMTPEMRKQQDAMYEYVLGSGQRQGIGAAMQNAMRAVTPYAEEGANALAKQSMAALQAAKQQEQFDIQQENWQKKFDTANQQWQQAFDQRNKDQSIANLLAMFPNTGWTPELLEGLGYGDTTRRMQQQFMQNTSPFANPSSVPGTQQGGLYGSGNAYPGQHQFYRNKAASNFGGRTGMLYAM